MALVRATLVLGQCFARGVVLTTVLQLNQQRQTMIGVQEVQPSGIRDRDGME